MHAVTLLHSARLLLKLSSRAVALEPRALSSILFGLAAIASPDPAFARNWLVLHDGSGDAPTIQAAVDSAAAAGDSIFVGPGSYIEEVLINNKSLVMLSLEGRDQTRIMGVLAPLKLTGSGTKKIVDLTFHGDIGAEGPGTFESCEFSLSHTGALGSGTYTSCVFDENGTGAATSVGQPASYISCVFTGNDIGAAGTSGSYVSCLFTRNGTGAWGSDTFVECEFRENGDGVLVDRGTLTNCDISDNTGYGLGITPGFPSSTVRIENCNVSRNGEYGILGGASFISDPVNVECRETTVSDNTLDGVRGFGFAGFTMVDCEISGNGAAGSAIWLNLTRCVVWGNADGLIGTQMESFGGGLVMTESTYHANGGGMRAEPGAFLQDPGQITVNRSIVSGTLAGRGIPQCSEPQFLILSVECSDIFGNAGGDDVCQAAGPNNSSLDPLFCDAAAGDFTLEANSPCAPANSPAGCNLIGALPVGCQTLAIEPAASPQLRFGVGQNRPNPFNPSTVIDFTLPVAMPVALRIYDASGRLVRTLVEDGLEAGNHIAVWDGREASGRAAASGIYYYRIESEGYGVATRKMMLVK
jgi:hypothetical protein